MSATGDRSEPVTRSRPYAPGYGIPSHRRGMISWDHVEERMAEARNYWVATVRPTGGRTPRRCGGSGGPRWAAQGA